MPENSTFFIELYVRYFVEMRVQGENQTVVLKGEAGYKKVRCRDGNAFFAKSVTDSSGLNPGSERGLQKGKGGHALRNKFKFFFKPSTSQQFGQDKTCDHNPSVFEKCMKRAPLL